MTTLEIGKKLVELCKQGKNDVAMDMLYAPDIVSIEPGAPPGKSPETHGMQAVVAKTTWWGENHTVHGATIEGPYPHGDQFIVKMVYDVTFKPTGKRFALDEMALYTVKDDKIVKEQFFYVGG